MSKSLHETQRLSFDGAVDADGHILEPPDLWENYLEPKYRDRALRIVRDDDGLEELEIGGRRLEAGRGGVPPAAGAHGGAGLEPVRVAPQRADLRRAPVRSRGAGQ